MIPRTILALVVLAPVAAAQVAVSLEATHSSPVSVGTEVIFAAKLTGETGGNYWYRFITYGENQQVRVVKDFGPDSTFEWVPSEQEGNYAVRVDARRPGEAAVAASVVAEFEVTSNVTGGRPVVLTTSHPLVALYSAPPCPAGSAMVVRYRANGDTAGQSTPAKECDGVHSMNFYLAGLRAATTYTATHAIEGARTQGSGPELEFVSGEIPDDLPEHSPTIAPSAGLPRRVVLGATIFSNFVATDLEGRVIWYYPRRMLFLTHPEPGGYFFGIDEVHGKGPESQIVRLFDVTGTTVLETNAGRVNEQLAAMGKRTIGAFHHEARFLSNGNILVLASVEQILDDVQEPGPNHLLGDMILVLDPSLRVVWTWDAFDHLDVRRAATLGDLCNRDGCPPTFLGDAPLDWLHGNAVTETPEGNLLLSLRSQDWVIKIDYQNGAGSGAVLWRLGKDGDFTIHSSDPNPWFSHQHDAEIEANGLLSLFDNGNVRQSDNPAATSRGQVFRIDEQSRVAELVVNADLGVYSFALGSAQLLENGNYFFNAGFRFTGNGVSLEVDRTGKAVYGLQSSAPMYRTFRLRDIYTP